MPDAPDGAKYLKQSNNIPLLENSELAVRLGAAYSYLRSGLVGYMTDFSNGLAGLTIKTGASADGYQLSTHRTTHGPFALFLYLEGGASSVITLVRSMSVWDVNQNGILIGFDLPYPKGNNATYLQIRMNYYDDSVHYNATLRLDIQSDELYVFDDTGSFTKIADVYDPIYNDGQVHYMKLIADFEAGTYLAAYFDLQVIDLTDYPLRITTTGGYGHFYNTLINFNGQDDSDGEIYIDSLVLTSDEPIGR